MSLKSAAERASTNAEPVAAGLQSVAQGSYNASSRLAGGVFAAPAQERQFRTAPAQARINYAPAWQADMFRLGPNDPRARMNYAPAWLARKDFAPSWYEQTFRAGRSDPRMIALSRALGGGNDVFASTNRMASFDPRVVSLRAVLNSRVTWGDIAAGRVASGRSA